MRHNQVRRMPATLLLPPGNVRHAFIHRVPTVLQMTTTFWTCTLRWMCGAPATTPSA